jgi:spermidine/putrescine transport system permease protein
VSAAEERAAPTAYISPPRRSRRIANALRGDAAQGLLLVSPTFLYALVLLAAPLALVLLLSFWTQNYLEIDRTFTLANYREAWTDPLYRLLMLRSLAISGIVTVLTVILAFPIAYFVAFHVKRNRALWLFLITIPFWTSYLLRVFLWKVILGYNGVLNSALIWLGLIEEPLTFILYDVNAVILTLTHAWAPFAILPIYVALSRIDRSLLEAAEDLGDGPLRRFFRVTLPLAMPGVLAAALIVFIPTVGDYVTPRLVGGSDGLMIANIIQVQFGKANDAPLGAALSVSSMAIVASAGRRDERGRAKHGAPGLRPPLSPLPLRPGHPPPALRLQRQRDHRLSAFRLHHRRLHPALGDAGAPRRGLEQPEGRRGGGAHQHRARHLRRAGGDAEPLSGQAADHGPHHGALGAAGDHHRGGAPHRADPARHAPLALDGRARPCPHLHALRGRHPFLRLPGARPEP